MHTNGNGYQPPMSPAGGSLQSDDTTRDMTAFYDEAGFSSKTKRITLERGEFLKLADLHRKKCLEVESLRKSKSDNEDFAMLVIDDTVLRLSRQFKESFKHLVTRIQAERNIVTDRMASRNAPATRKTSGLDALPPPLNASEAEAFERLKQQGVVVGEYTPAKGGLKFVPDPDLPGHPMLDPDCTHKVLDAGGNRIITMKNEPIADGTDKGTMTRLLRPASYSSTIPAVVAREQREREQSRAKDAEFKVIDSDKRLPK